MPTASGNVTRFAEGATVVLRNVRNGKIWSAAPFRVIADTGAGLVIACWPGTENLAPATFTEWLRTGDASIRAQAIPHLASGQWELARFTWRDTTLTVRSGERDYFSVHRYAGGDRSSGKAHHRGGWYVNFELPRQRTAIGVDTLDLLLDLLVEPDLSGYAWKDEDEYAHARRLGVIDDALHARLDEERQRVLALIESREAPFTEDWAIHQPDPHWATPELPPDALVVPTAL